MAIDSKFRSRKFFLACTALSASIVGVFTEVLSEQSFVVLVAGILGLYGYHNLQDKG
jgi:hypothetical protein